MEGFDADAGLGPAGPGKAQKRAAKKAAGAATIWLPIILGVNAVYAFFGIYMRWEEVGLWDGVLLVSTSAAYYWAYTSILRQAGAATVSAFKTASEDRSGASADGLDIFAMTAAAQLGSLLTSYAWLIFLGVPGMLAYRLYLMFQAVRGMMPAQPATATGSASAAAEGGASRDSDSDTDDRGTLSSKRRNNRLMTVEERKEERKMRKAQKRRGG